MGGVEVDLPRLHQLVEDTGGPKKMVDKKDWAKIADLMNIPKQVRHAWNEIPWQFDCLINDIDVDDLYCFKICHSEWNEILC